MALLVLAVLAGCTTMPVIRNAGPGRGYQPDNIFKLAPTLPMDLRRVALLPLSSSDQRAELLAGCEAVEPVLVAELIKAKRFEVVQVSPQALRSLTGRDHWSAAENLPPEFFDALREACGCEAILFAELTEYRAYTPVAIGWRLRLVDAHTGIALWASDELLDSRNPGVAVAARRCQSREQRSFGETGGDWAVLHSPRRFAQYSVAQLFDTLPLP
jgi:hypothetical protein